MTIEQRNTLRQEILKKLGYDPTISEIAAGTIQTLVATELVIQSVEFTGYRLTLNVVPKMDTTFNRISKLEAYLSKTFGSEPYRYATEFNQYRLTFFAN